MFFVVEKSRFERLISLSRNDQRTAQQGKGGPFFRIEASGGQVRLTGREMEAAFPATVYEEGVLFLRVTIFRKVLQAVVSSDQIAVQVREDGLHIGDIKMPLESNDMLLYLDPARAPERHPEEVANEAKPDNQGMLFP